MLHRVSLEEGTESVSERTRKTLYSHKMHIAMTIIYIQAVEAARPWNFKHNLSGR